MAEELELIVDGRTYSGWENATLFRTIEACCGSFTFDVADVSGAWKIREGAFVQILLDRRPFATGRVGSVKRSLDTTGRRISIEGRDLAGDLVDCSAVIEAGEMWDVTLQDLAALIAAPLDVEIVFGPNVDVGEPFRIVAINPGEGAWETLEKCLRMRGLLAFSQPTGELLITTPSAADPVAAIAEGDNLLSADVTRDETGRFRDYVVTSQRKGDDEDSGDVVAFPSGTAVDVGARERRTLILQAEQAADQEMCERRALWEATTRAARSIQVSARVTGWRRPGPTSNETRGRTGPVWSVNERIRLRSPSLDIDEVLLVASCRYTLSKDGGRVTDLGLMRRDAFLAEPIQPEGEFGPLGQEDDE